jgi:hypothetical protein
MSEDVAILNKTYSAGQKDGAKKMLEAVKAFRAREEKNLLSAMAIIGALLIVYVFAVWNSKTA